MAAVGKGREECRIFGVDQIAEALEFQIADDLFLHQARQVRRRRDPIAGPDLLRNRAPAHQFAAFEHQHAASSAGQIRRRDQAVMAGADDDDVVGFRHVL